MKLGQVGWPGSMLRALGRSSLPKYVKRVGSEGGAPKLFGPRPHSTWGRKFFETKGGDIHPNVENMHQTQGENSFALIFHAKIWSSNAFLSSLTFLGDILS